MDLAELLAGLEVTLAPGSSAPAGVRVCDVTDDSRTVVPGSLFVARRGLASDGRGFIPEAVASGAVAVLTDAPPAGGGEAGGVPVVVARDIAAAAAAIAERFYGNPTGRLTLVGVTGTNGKTTTAHLVHQALNDAGVRCGLIGTVVVDDGREVAPASLTTPPAVELSRTFATMVECGCRAGVMEVSSHALAQGRAAALEFDAAVFTNLTGDHLDYHGTMEAYGAAKARLFGMLTPDGWAIVNEEDPWAERMLRACRARVLRCSIGPAARAGRGVAIVRSMGMSGSGVVMAGPWGEVEATIRVPGRHNVMNALQAFAACHLAGGIEAGVLGAALSRAGAPPGRLEPVTPHGHPFTVLVDYAHTDDAIRKALGAIAPLMPVRGPDGSRLVIVFGCGGDRDPTKRPRMGAAAVELADVVHVTSDNPRREDPRAIIDAILAGVPGELRHKLRIEPDRRGAIEAAIADARAGDVILIAGKGHEDYQILPDGRGGTYRVHFDDREVARAALGLVVGAPAADSTREVKPSRTVPHGARA